MSQNNNQFVPDVCQVKSDFSDHVQSTIPEESQKPRRTWKNKINGFL